jgi:hypothetical protein
VRGEDENPVPIAPRSRRNYGRQVFGFRRVCTLRFTGRPVGVLGRRLWERRVQIDDFWMTFGGRIERSIGRAGMASLWCGLAVLVQIWTLYPVCVSAGAVSVHDCWRLIGFCPLLQGTSRSAQEESVFHLLLQARGA